MGFVVFFFKIAGVFKDSLLKCISTSKDVFNHLASVILLSLRNILSMYYSLWGINLSVQDESSKAP